MSIGARVKQARSLAKLSRKSLSNAADVSERYLTQLENGQANVSIGILARLSQALGLDFALLATGAIAIPEPGGLEALLGNLSARDQQQALAHLSHYLRERQGGLRGIALLGLRGAGKSTIGGLFAKRHGLPFLSITREIETRAGMSLNELFNLGGSDGYRLHENEVVAEIAQRRDLIVLETAGGIVGNAKVLDSILGTFKTVWLKATPEEHLRRVTRQGDLRPMRGKPKALEHLKTLLAQREPDYARAEFVIDTTSKSLEACVEELTTIAGAFLPKREPAEPPRPRAPA